MKLIVVLLLFLGSLQAQVLSSPASRLRKGPGVPVSGDCVGAGDVGRVWIRSDLAGAGNPTSVCGNTGAGTYGWVTTAGGAQGPAGAAGPTGPTGPTGSAGANGTNGAAGATGPTGPTGAAGAAGVGIPNASCDIASGTTCTITHSAALSSPFPTVVNCFDYSNGSQALGFTAPPATNSVVVTFPVTVTTVRCVANVGGAAGAAGAAGPTGPTGAAGGSGLFIPLQMGSCYGNTTLVGGGGWYSNSANLQPYCASSIGTGAWIITNGAATTDVMHQAFPLPPSFPTPATLQLILATGDSSATVKTEVAYACKAPGNATFKAPTYSSKVAVTTVLTGSAPEKGYSATWTLDLSGCAAGDYLWIQIDRDNSVGSNLADWLFIVAGSITG